MMTVGFDPLVPRPIDRPTTCPSSVTRSGRADRAKIFAAPDDPADWPAWRDSCAAGATAPAGGSRRRLPARRQLGGALLQQALVWLWDERLFDHDARRFTADRFLDDAERFGGFDGVVLWHAYPVIGIDDRNQFDFYRDVPGSRLVAELHDRGVQVFVDYNPWDTGTRREPTTTPTRSPRWSTTLGVDGVFLDTLQ